MKKLLLINGVSQGVEGSLFTMGLGLHGRLGHGNTTYYSSPKAVGSLTTWTYAAGGFRHSAAVRSDGTLWTAFSNSFMHFKCSPNSHSAHIPLLK